MTTQTIEIVITAKGAVSVKRDIKDVADEAKKASKDVSDLQAALTALVSAATIKSIIGMADAWTDYNSRVNLAAGSTEKGALVMSRLSQIANDTYSSLEQTTEAYLSNASSLRELGYSTNEMLDYTAAMNDAFVVSGIKGQAAETVMNALSKSMASGSLSGQNLTTVIQQGGKVAELLAAQLGVSTNALAAMGAQGRITSDVIFKSLTGAMAQLRVDAESMPATVADAMVQLRNSVLEFIGTTDQAYGITAQLATAIKYVADNFAYFATALSPVIAGLLLFAGAAVVGFVITMLTQLVSTINLVVTAIRLLSLAILSNPLALIATAVAGIVLVMYQWRDSVQWIDTLFTTLSQKMQQAFDVMRRIFAEFGFISGGELKVTAVDGGLGYDIRKALDDGGTQAGRNIVKEMEEGEKRKKEKDDKRRKEEEELRKKEDEARRKRDEEARKKSEAATNKATEQALVLGHNRGGIAAGDNIRTAISNAGSDLSAMLIAAMEYGGIMLMGMFEKMFDAQMQIMNAQANLLNAQANQANAAAEKSMSEARQLEKRFGNSGGSGGSSGYGDSGTSTYTSYDPRYDKRIAEREAAEKKEREKAASNYSAPSFTPPPSERTFDVRKGSELNAKGTNKTDVNLETNINNILDPNTILGALDTSKGRETIINIFKAYPDEFKLALGY